MLEDAENNTVWNGDVRFGYLIAAVNFSSKKPTARSSRHDGVVEPASGGIRSTR